jgi:glycosyltransferase involved in cell wall biosynthesis
MQAGKPILMGVPGDAADLVTEAGAGLAFEPGNPAALAAAVRRLMAMPAEEREAMGRAGALYYRDHLSLEVGTRAFVQLFEQADTRH